MNTVLKEESKIRKKDIHKACELDFETSLVRFCFPDVGFAQRCGLDWIDHSETVTRFVKKTNQVFGIEPGGFQTEDQVAFGMT